MSKLVALQQSACDVWSNQFVQNLKLLFQAHERVHHISRKAKRKDDESIARMAVKVAFVLIVQSVRVYQMV